MFVPLSRLLIAFKNCTVTYQDTILFDPSWGIYDMAVGMEIVSAYAGPASVNSFEDVAKVSETKTHKISYSQEDKALYKLYGEVRSLREDNTVTESKIERIFTAVSTNFKNDWLLPLELFELAVKYSYQSQKEIILKHLEDLKCNKSYTTLIEKGLALCNEN